MGKGFFQVPTAVNEPIKTYAQGTPEREEVLKTYREMYKTPMDVPLYSGAEEISTGNTKPMSPPHDHQHHLGDLHRAEKQHIEQAINAALEAKTKWADLPWEQLAALFPRPADLVAGPSRARTNPAPMMPQSKAL